MDCYDTIALPSFQKTLLKRFSLGAYGEWGTPVPIPNTAVKPLIADDTINLVK